MALLPLLFDEIRPVRRNWSLSLLAPFLDEDLVNFKTQQLSKTLHDLEQAEKSEITTTKDNFQASVDVQQFKPEEITVKLTGDNVITIEGKHEERQDEHGYISRHFIRKYTLPEEFDAEKLQSKLTSDGVLNITAPKKLEGKQVPFREIPITLTGPVKSVGQKVQKKFKPKRLGRKGSHK